MRNLTILTICGLLTFVSGCASMCDSSFDCDFHAFGGMRDRIDRKNGRVGSIFDPASAQPSVVPAVDPLLDSDVSTDNEPALPSKTDKDDTEDSELKRRLLDALDGKDPLPTIPPDSGDAPGLDGGIFQFNEI